MEKKKLKKLPPRNRMAIQRLDLACLKKGCGTLFVGEIVIQCPIPVAAASMRALRCPMCGSKKVGFVLDKTKNTA